MTNTDEVRSQIRLLRDLRAVRHFRPDPIPAEVLEDIYEVTRWTGSAENLQPWNLVVIQERETLDQLAAIEGYADHLQSAPLGIVLAMDNHNPEFATYDEGRLAERIMLVAAAHGLGSCIGWWPERGREKAQRVIGAPDTHIVRNRPLNRISRRGRSPLPSQTRERPETDCLLRPSRAIRQQRVNRSIW